VTSSEAVLPILPNIELAKRKKRLFGVIYGAPKLLLLYKIYFVCRNYCGHFVHSQKTTAAGVVLSVMLFDKPKNVQ